MSRDTDEKNPYKAFQTGPVEPKFPRDRGFAVLHTRLEITLDDRERRVHGTALLRVRPLHAINRIELDAADMTIQDVRIEGKRVAFEHVEPALLIQPPRKLKENVEVEVAIRYDARPRRGLYFIAPDKAYPKKPVQMWSQGESEDNHHWFPGYDYPNNKASSEALLTVRTPLVAVSNGHLESKQPAGKGWTTYHWKQDVPQPNYLIAVVVGAFDEVQDTWNGIPLHHFVPKGKKAWAVETFKRTANILEFFARVTGHPYPFPKYAQAVIADFMWGGMENSSMTTVNERFLILPEHRDDADPDGLIAHEAAHQWFGDLVTTKSWDQIWLNEGFATYFDALWHESFHGQDMFQQELVDNADAYFAEDSGHYRRPIVTRVFAENEDLFDRHTYQKGSLVLHMLRNELGDELWWKAIRHYVAKFAWKNVETADLKIAIEEATGRNLDWFFEQWIHKAGHPQIEARWEYDEKAKAVKLHLKQTQVVVGDTPLFRVPLTVWTWTGEKVSGEHTIVLRRADETFYLPCAKRPELVQVDPHGAILKKLQFEKAAREWAHQLRHAPDASARIEAARALGKKSSDPAAADALEHALLKDAFWGIRRAAATALGEHGTARARTALAKAVKDKHPRVRRAVARALGTFRRDPEAAKILQKLLRAETRSDYVVAAALFGLAQTRDASALSTLKRYAKRASHNEIVRTSLLAGLGELQDPAALAFVQSQTPRGVHPYVRAAAMACLAKLWDAVGKPAQREIRDTLAHFMKDATHVGRRAAYAAAAEVPDAELAKLLGNLVESEPIGLLKKVARDSLRSVQDRLGDQARVGDLKRQFDELQAENRKLQARVADLEARMAPPRKPRRATRKPN